MMARGSVLLRDIMAAQHPATQLFVLKNIKCLFYMVTKLPRLIAGSVKGHIPVLSKGRGHDISGHFMVYTLGQTSAMGNKTIKFPLLIKLQLISLTELAL